MKQFNMNATSLTIRFTCEECEEPIEFEVTEIPQPNYMAENINDSENSHECNISYDEEHSYRVILYANTAEGNIEIFDEETDEEIEDFEIEENFAQENNKECDE